MPYGMMAGQMQGASQAQAGGFPGTQVPAGAGARCAIPGRDDAKYAALRIREPARRDPGPVSPTNPGSTWLSRAMPGYGQMPGVPGAFPQQPAYYPGYQQGYPMQGFQQHQGYPQPGYPQAGAAGQGYTQIAAAPAQQGPYVSERGAAALLFIYQNGKGGRNRSHARARALGRHVLTRARRVGEHGLRA